MSELETKLYSILSDYGDFFLTDYPHQAETKSIHPTIQRILALIREERSVYEQLVREYYQWIEQGINEGDKTLTAEEYRQWAKNMDAMQQRARELLGDG